MVRNCGRPKWMVSGNTVPLLSTDGWRESRCELFLFLFAVSQKKNTRTLTQIPFFPLSVSGKCEKNYHLSSILFEFCSTKNISGEFAKFLKEYVSKYSSWCKKVNSKF